MVPRVTRPGGATRVAAVIGSPIRHSLSPVLHNAAFRALDLDWVFLAFEVAPGDGAAAVDAMRALGIEGLSVTMPHKADVLPALDLLSPTAEKLGAVNTVTRQGDRLLGESTDGPGFLDALRLDEGFDPAGKRCVVLGAGGAARAVVLALAEAGAAELVVVNRTAERAHEAVALAAGVGRLGEAAAAADADLIVNATSVGMGDGRAPIDPAILTKGQLVVDLVYHPAVTPLVAGARAAGATAVNGLGMLIHQAAHAFRHWTGQEPPLPAMSAAALASMARADLPKT
ncbi:MAG: shikimate dehydrogenase [Actinomycetota bacterium]|nr:shikimate dehydrogenase [Actinomycetota bacterium]